MSKVFVNAGHYLKDPGQVLNGQLEADLVMLIRNKLKIMLPKAHFVPDELDLRESIDWINERADEGDLAIGLHLNGNSNVNVSGTECYYAYKDKMKIAESFATIISRELGIPNRGAKHDSETYVGSLGFLRKTKKCKAVLVEFGYLTNKHDRMKLTSEVGLQKCATGVYKAILQMRGEQEHIMALQLTIMALANEVVKLIKVLIGLYRK